MKKQIRNVMVTVVSVLVFLLFVYPLIYTVLNSLKTYDDFTSSPQYALPAKVFFGNFVKVFQSDFIRYFINSVVIAVLVVVFTVVLSATTAFAISKFRFRGKKIAEIYFLLGLMIPYQVILIPLYLTYAKFKLLDTYFSLILPQVAFGMPMAVQLFLAFFKDFEEELIEAAVIDGSSIGRAFISVVAPICRNIIITVATLRAIFSWNEYIFSYTFISSKKMMTVVLGLNAFVGEEGLVDWGPTFAAIVVTVIPTLLVYMFLGKYMQSGLSEGAVKS
ncbi:MAG: carbohydrate ABC transporter permease [Lachnospiraceae bacterium]|nr:carbohydrate ABC transporter permease [Lachnospiraceae bacterium]